MWLSRISQHTVPLGLIEFAATRPWVNGKIASKRSKSICTMAFQGRSVRLWKAILRLRLQHLMQLGLKPKADISRRSEAVNLCERQFVVPPLGGIEH